jgi:uncharacterized repeat protein (TIGR03803 family)
MRIGTLIFAGAFLAGCSHLSGAPAIPVASSNAAVAPAEPDAVQYATIYSFRNGNRNGGSPQAGLLALRGNLYGTTSAYGSRGYGTVFEVSPFGQVKMLHTFTGVPDGAYPLAGLIYYHGTFYGTTSAGGVHGGGTVFSVTPSGDERVIHSFGAGGDGAFPAGGLVALNGIFYGTTQNGGRRNRGTVFEITPSGRERVLHSFVGAPTDGGHPTASLIVVKGVLYGTARAGGKVAPGGCVFKITPFGQERVLHSFRVARGDGSNPAGRLLYYNGYLYGTTLHGGSVGTGFGTVFVMTTTGRESVLHSFGEGTDGAFPDAGLIPFNGQLYSTTTGGGLSQRQPNHCISSGRCGTIFKISPFGIEHVIYRFKGNPDGANPEAGLTESSGALYGTTYWGGGSNYYGTIFRIIP